MIGAIVHRHRIHGIATEHLNYVARFQVVLAEPSKDGIGRQPPGRLVIDEWIVVGFQHLVTVSGDVLKAADEQAGIDPAGIHHHVTALAIAVAGHTRLEVIGVEAEHAAVVGSSVVKIDIVEQQAVMSRVVISPASSAAPITVSLVTGKVGGKSAPENAVAIDQSGD